LFDLAYNGSLFSNFWQYFEPIRQNMPKNCSADVQTVISHIDKTFTGKDTKAIESIKDMFGMADLTHLDDVAGARACIFVTELHPLILLPHI
jgi:hypothetical protein